MSKIANVYSISYSRDLKNSLDPGFGIIGDENNPRPEWYEYWHIRKFLASNSMEEGKFYGFFSPKFQEKTGLSSADVYLFLEQNKERDVVLFSPFLDQIALFLNIIEQANFAHPELVPIFREVCDLYFPEIDPLLMVNSSEDTVFCNFFVAKPEFWARWYKICEDIFQLTENCSNSLGEALAGVTRYKNTTTSLRTFVIERIATLILFSDARWRVASHSTYSCEVGKMSVAKSTALLLALDALKTRYVATNATEFLSAYLDLRLALIKGTTPAEFRDLPNSPFGRFQVHTNFFVNELRVRRNIDLPRFGVGG